MFYFMSYDVHVWKAVYGHRAADFGGGGQKLYGSTAEAFKLIHLLKSFLPYFLK